ncbi:2-octaprenyl-3-methyl-6-methoxy-1,4-benzoquinol hydroxylase [Escherichia coli]|nr:2-octaprenyl-3-methyl-6-methoxy-1,4-benzoquinol hydroxylase [Escherichia coli]
MTINQRKLPLSAGGMVGGALALGLAQHGFTVTVIEHAEPAPFVADSQPGRADLGDQRRIGIIA